VLNALEALREEQATGKEEEEKAAEKKKEETSAQAISLTEAAEKPATEKTSASKYQVSLSSESYSDYESESDLEPAKKPVQAPPPPLR
jgi:hypothetical protein